MKDTVKMIAAIVIFAVVACAGLAVVVEKTTPAINENKARTTADALAGLFPDATGNSLIAGGLQATEDGVTLGDVYKMEKDGKLIGLAVTSSSFGFNADVKALVGVGVDGKITGVKILENTDTPGLGANAGKETYYVDKPNKITFYGQFAGKSADGLAVQKDGGSIVAITASTITSRGVTKLVRGAAVAGANWLEKNGGSN
jgi:electron transport complex protein RnfG